jgi:hypothetical protein
LVLNFRKNLLKCYTWSIALYGDETWALRKLHEKYLDISKMRCCRKMETIIWTDLVGNEEYSESQEAKKYPTCNKKKEG